jgi:hypothetical protein
MGMGRAMGMGMVTTPNRLAHRLYPTAQHLQQHHGNGSASLRIQGITGHRSATELC